jgi:KaiC/GvpD/RAD55 family RecA-like ATPase
VPRDEQTPFDDDVWVGAEAAEASPKVGGLALVPFDDMRPQLADGYLIKGLLASTAMAVLYGESGTGKTFLALHLALCVAAGAEFFGHRVRRAGIVYVAAEAGRSIENRVAAAKHEVEFPETMPFAAIETPIDLCSKNADVEKLIATVHRADIGMPVELVIIDTLSRVMAGGNENQPDHMGAFVRNVDRLRAETGAAVLIVHHTGKVAERGARGHSLLRAATDTEIEVTKDEATKLATARVTKQREFATEGSLSFMLRLVELGIDREGDPITSCIVEPADSEQLARKPSRPKLSDKQQIAFDTLRRAVTVNGQPAPAHNHIPNSATIVPEDLWRRFYLAGTSADGQSDDTRRKAWRDARVTL